MKSSQFPQTPGWFRSALRFVAFLLLVAVSAKAEPLPERVYLFSYFKEPNGQDGLHLAWSRDGLTWVSLKNDQSFLKPALKGGLMRDPCVHQGPEGTFHMVWTTGWGGKTIGYASTKDFLTWSDQKELSVMQGEPQTKNCWAPEIIFDAPKKQFMIFWASTVMGKFTETYFEGKNHRNHRIYAVTTPDFVNFSPTKLLFDPGFNCIDSTLLQRNGKTYMFFKDETNWPTPIKNLRMAVANDVQGPYEVAPSPISPKRVSAEGPTALQIGDMTYLYYDCFTAHHYGVLRSRDLKNWEDVTSQISMPKGIRHGTAFEVPGTLVSALMAIPLAKETPAIN